MRRPSNRRTVGDEFFIDERDVYIQNDEHRRSCVATIWPTQARFSSWRNKEPRRATQRRPRGHRFWPWRWVHFRGCVRSPFRARGYPRSLFGKELRSHNAQAACEQRSPCKQTRPAAVQSSSGLQNRYHASSSRTAEVLGQTDAVPRHLALACVATKWHYDIAYLADTGCAHGMTLGLQTAASVNRKTAADRRAARCCKWTAFSLICETQVFCCDDFSDGEAVVHFGQVYVSRA